MTTHMPARGHSAPASDVFHLSFPTLSILFVLALGLCLVPIFRHDVISVTDLQNHLSRIWVLLHYDATPAFQKYFRVEWQPIPNLALDVFGVLVGRLVSLDLTGKLFVATTHALLLSGAVSLHRASFRRWSVWPLLAALLLYNRPLLIGFAGYLFGVGLYLHATALWLGLREKPAAVRAACSSALALVVFFAHLFALGLLGLTILGLELARALRMRSPLKFILRDLAVAEMQFVLPLLIYVFLTPHGEVETAIAYRDFMTRLTAFAAPLLYEPVLDAALFALLGALALLFAVKRALRLDLGLATAAALLLATQLVIPNTVTTAFGADHRIPIVLYFLAICGTDVVAGSRAMRVAFSAAAAAVLAARLWMVDAAWTSYDPVYADALAGLAAVPPGSAVAPAFPSDAFDSSTNPAIAVFYLPLRVAIVRGGVAPRLYALPTQNPLLPRPAYRELQDRFSANVLWRDFVTGAGPSPGAIPEQDLRVLRRFDYLVAVNNAEFSLPPSPLLEPVYLGRWTKVYRIEKSAKP